MKSQQDILNGLPQFSGSEAYHRWSPLFQKTVLTDGVKWLAQNAECFWLMDIIGSVQPLPKIKSEAFLTVSYNKEKGEIVIDDGNGNVLYEQDVVSSTFPLDEIKLFVTDGEDGYRIIMLPSEY